MALTPEWKRRIEYWKKELKNHFYRPLGDIELKGFVTTKQLTVDDALKCDFQPMPVGTPWGAKWEYGWFKGSVVLPEEAKRKRIVVKMDTGAESAVYVNGQNAGAKDWAHHEVTLTYDGVPGEKYQIVLESYAGHGPRECHAGPIPPGRETVPEPGPTQAVVGKNTYGIWEEEVYQLWIDVETLFQVRESIDKDSLRVAEIDQGLRDFTTIVDFEVPYEEMLATVRAGRERLKPLLECINGSTAPTMFVFGHSHIDVAWLWPLEETERKCTRTFATQMALMEEYPEYQFLQSQPHLYRMMKQHYPELYKRIKEAVKKGQFIPDGGMWVEPDTNLAGGESLIRQFIHGKRFYKDEFGINSEMCWLPDVFGYSGAFPQIMKGCGIKYFSTQKIFWTYNGGEPFPYHTFIWEGIDGSEVLAHIHNDYNSLTEPKDIISRWNERVQKDGISTRLFPFGHGDGGGGATRDHLEFLRRCKNLEGVPKTQMCHPVEFFEDQEKRGIPDARYVGELYFQAHRGTYTSQAKTKKGNRKSEFALREAEMWGIVAKVFKDFAFSNMTLDETWKNVLLNQFHDIIPGSSIARVYEQAEADYQKILATAQEVTDNAVQKLTDKSQALTAFNSLSWDRKALIALPDGFNGTAEQSGKKLTVQKIDGKTFAEVLVPSCGWTTICPTEESSNDSNPNNNIVKASKTQLENELLRVTFNENGEIISIYDKEAGFEMASGACNSFKMYKDVPTYFDAWDIDSMYPLTPVELHHAATIEVLTEGPLVAKIKISKKLNNSTLSQIVSLRRGSRRVDFETTVDWQESHKLLKVNFPVNIYANEAVHEIQFGHIKRPNHYSRPFDADRFEVSNHKWSALIEENRGFAILNDCKYGINVLGNSMNLTLLKSALAPDMTADKGLQEFTYSFYVWNGSFADSEVIREGYDLNCPIITAEGAAGEKSIFSMDAPNIIIETVKPAEDGSDDIVLRLYEAKRTATRCTLTTSLPIASASRTNMLEEVEENISLNDNRIELTFRPFEIKTVRLKVK